MWTGKWHGELAAWLPQDLAQAGIKVQSLSRKIELLLGDFPWVDRGRDVFGRHRRKNLVAGRRPSTASSSWAVSRTTPRGAAAAAF